MSCSCGDQSCSCVGICLCPFHFCLCIACFNLRKSISVKIEEKSGPFEFALGLSRDIQKYEGTGTKYNSDDEKFTQISNLTNDELENEVVFIGSYNTNKKGKTGSSSTAHVPETVLSDSDCEIVFEIQNSSNDNEWIDVEEKRSSKKTLGDLNRKRNRRVKSVCSSSNIIANSKCKSHKRSWSNCKSDQNEILTGSNISSFLNQSQVSLGQHENITAQDYKNTHVKENKDNVRENWFFSQKSFICGTFNAKENITIQETSVANIENKFLKSETNQYINENNGTKQKDSLDINAYEAQENEATEKLLPNIRNNFPELKTILYDSCKQYFCFKSGKQNISGDNSGSERNSQNSETSVIFKYGENSASFGQRTDLSLPMTTVVQANESSKEVGFQSPKFPRNHHEKLPDFSARDYEEKNIKKSMPDHDLFTHPKFHERHGLNKDSGELLTAYRTLTEHKYSENGVFQIVDDESGCKYARNKEFSVQNLSYPSSSNSCYNHHEPYNHLLQNADDAAELSDKATRNEHISFQNSCSYYSQEIRCDSTGSHAIRKRRLKSIKKENAGAKICTINDIIHKKAPVRWIRRRRRRKRTVKRKKKSPVKKIKKSDCVKEIKKIKIETKTEIKKEIKKEYE